MDIGRVQAWQKWVGKSRCNWTGYLHTAGIVLSLGHSDVEPSLLISSSGCCNCSIGLLVGAVDSQLIKRDLRLETMSVQLKIISGVQ